MTALEPATEERRGERFLGRSVPGLAVAAVVVGLGAGLGAVVFREAVVGVTRLLTGQEDYAATPGARLSWLPGVGTWFLVVLPVIGGLLYGPLVYRFAREARGHGVPEVMLAVAEGGRIRPRVAVVKILASALTIGSGGSVGREGPIVQIGSAIGSSLGQWMRMPTHRLRLLVACGAGGGISATFNAPVAGVFFALEIILLDFTMLSFVVVVAASAIANVVAALVEGAGTFLELPPFAVGSLNQYWLFALLGVGGGLLGVPPDRAAVAGRAVELGERVQERHGVAAGDAGLKHGVPHATRPGPDWTPPSAFRLLDGGPDGGALLLGPVAGLDDLAASLGTGPDAP